MEEGHSSLATILAVLSILGAAVLTRRNSHPGAQLWLLAPPPCLSGSSRAVWQDGYTQVKDPQIHGPTAENTHPVILGQGT